MTQVQAPSCLVMTKPVSFSYIIVTLNILDGLEKQVLLDREAETC